jgi:hypothetical protein
VRPLLRQRTPGRRAAGYRWNLLRPSACRRERPHLDSAVRFHD